ncbi:MAG: hypothetical protein ACE5JZ_04975 [Kiloniellales bacterium]
MSLEPVLRRPIASMTPPEAGTCRCAAALPVSEIGPYVDRLARGPAA